MIEEADDSTLPSMVSSLRLSNESLIARTYDTAADFFDDPAIEFWAHFGHGTVDRLSLQPGAAVLDVCCGAGASAIPAAERVGPRGSVIAVDFADRLLDLGRAKAKARGLSHIEFLQADMRELDLPDRFEAVVCVFGIFFVDDMVSQMARLWRMVRPGGQLAITTWGPRAFEPASGFFWEAVRQERPDLDRAFNAWDRITTPDAVAELFDASGIRDVVVEAEDVLHPLRTVDDWWTIAMGTGYRATIEKLEPAARSRVREACARRLRASETVAIETNGLYATATKTA